MLITARGETDKLKFHFTGGALHKEIFYFKRAKSGKFKGKEWEEIVRPVLIKWGGFVENYAERTEDL